MLRAACNYGCLAFAIFAAVCAAVATRRSSGRIRLAWLALTVAVAGWAVGSALWIYYEMVVDQSPFPSPADAAYLMFPIAALAGVSLMPVGFSGHSRTRLVLDGVITSAALFQISWVTVLRDVYDAGAASRFAMGLSLAYPIGDLIVVTVALLLLARARSGQRATLSLLAIGLILMGLSDSAFVYLTAHDAYHGGTPADIGWVCGLLVIGIAALFSDGEAALEAMPVRPPSRAAMMVPYLPIAISAVVCAPVNLRVPGMAALFASTAVLVVAVLVRQYFVVMENRRLLDVVAEQALRDPLTGLANRALFNDRLTHAMQLHVRDRQPVAVASLDLDHFKLVNDNLGHPAGDALLKQVADRIVGAVRTGDTVARLGGDEFAVLMEGSILRSTAVADGMMRTFDEPFLVDGHELMVRPSMGLTVAPAEDGDLTGDELLKQADMAMYAAKRSRTGGVHSYDPTLHGIGAGHATRGGGSKRVATVKLLGQLRHAIDHSGLSLVYQPKYALGDGSIVGVEALVRCRIPRGECSVPRRSCRSSESTD